MGTWAAVRRTRVRRWVALLAAVTVFPGTAAAFATPSAAAVPGRYLLNEPAMALVNPSTVHLQATWTGVVRDRATGAPLHPASVVHRRQCSAVVVNPDGYAVSTNLCVQPSTEVLLANVLNEVARARVSRGEMTGGQVAAFVTERMKTAEFTGAQRGQAPALTVAGWQISHTDGDGKTPIPVAVVFAQPAVSGNVAVVRLGRQGLPAVEIVKNDGLAVGNPVVLSGFSGDGKAPAQSYALRNRSTVINGRSPTNRLSVEGGIGPQARGGAVADLAGRLVALQDADITSPGEPVRDLIKATHINRALADAKVANDVGAGGLAYRAALMDYFAGRFSAATMKFEALLRTAPGNTAARTYRDQARERRDMDGDAIANAADWPMYGLSAVAGTALIVLLQLALRRRRPATEAASTPPATPRSASS